MKAVIYARFSPRPNSKQAKTSDRKQDGECLTIEQQLAYCYKYCELREYTIVGEFEEPDTSAATLTKRPEFEKAVSLACKHKAILLGHRFDRLFRNVKDAIITAERIDRAGANLQTASGVIIDTTTAVGRMFFTVLAAIAQMLREDGAERTSAAMLYYQSQGRRMSHNLPYGWRTDPNDSARMLEHEGEQAVIQAMLELNGKGMGPYAIASALARNGVLARSGKKFSHTTILQILKRNGDD